MVAVYQPERTQEYLAAYRWDVSFHGRIRLVNALWLLGYPDQALLLMQETVRLVQQTTDPQTKALVLLTASWGSLLMRNSEAAQMYAEACLVECEQHGLTQEHGWASAFRGGAFAQQSKPVEGAAEIRAGMAALQTMHAEIAFAYYSALLAEVFGQMGDAEQGLVVLAEGFAAMERNDEREFEAELFRVKGDLLVAGNRQLEAENSYQQAIAVSRQQNTKSLELRTATSLARLWQRQVPARKQGHSLRPTWQLPAHTFSSWFLQSEYNQSFVIQVRRATTQSADTDPRSCRRSLSPGLSTCVSSDRSLGSRKNAGS